MGTGKCSTGLHNLNDQSTRPSALAQYCAQRVYQPSVGIYLVMNLSPSSVPSPILDLLADRFSVSSPSNPPAVISVASSEDSTVQVHNMIVSPGGKTVNPDTQILVPNPAPMFSVTLDGRHCQVLT